MSYSNGYAQAYGLVNLSVLAANRGRGGIVTRLKEECLGLIRAEGLNGNSGKILTCLELACNSVALECQGTRDEYLEALKGAFEELPRP